MAQAMASMAGLCGSSQAVLEGSLQLSGSTRLSGIRNSRVGVVRSGLTVRAQQMSSESEGVAQSSRRAILGLVASASFVQVMLADAKATPLPPLSSRSFVPVVLADATSIKLGPPPPPSGGLPGTLNSDEARDLDLPLKNRFFIQPLPPAEAAVRAKESAKEILNVKEFIDKKAWPYVQNDLRLRASYLRYDLKSIIAGKSKEEKKPLQELTGKLFSTIDGLDHAAKIKSTPEAQKYYAETVSALKDVLAKIG